MKQKIIRAVLIVGISSRSLATARQVRSRVPYDSGGNGRWRDQSHLIKRGAAR
jgi:hypothetical protein